VGGAHSQAAGPSRVTDTTAEAGAPRATQAQRRELAKPQPRAKPVVPHGVRSVLHFGVTRDVTLRSGEVVRAGATLNYGRIACENAPAGCTFRGDFLGGMLSHQQHCTYSGGAGGDAAARAGRAVCAAGAAGGAVSGAADEEDAPLPSDGGGSDSGQCARERAAAGGREKRKRAAGEPDGRGNNRGARRRKRYTYEDKAEALDGLAAGLDAEAVAANLGVSPSNISRWKSNADEIYDAAGDACRKKLLGDAGRKGGRTARWPAMEAELVSDIKKLRARGRNLSLRWLRVRSRQIYDALYPEHAGTFMASRSWRRRFIKRSNLVRRKKTNSKRKPVEERLPKIRIWHGKLARMLHRTARGAAARGAAAAGADEAAGADGQGGAGAAGVHVDEKWGLYPPERRANLDQVPGPFAPNLGPTLEFRGTKKVVVVQPGNGLEKRQFTFNVCFLPRAAQQPPLGILFRGTGARISRSELAAYDKRVMVSFQKKAWMDRPQALEWLRRVWKPYTDKIAPDDNWLLFLDNLDAHVKGDFRPQLKEVANTLAWLLEPDATDFIQAVDAGAGRETVRLFGEAQDKWLDVADNLERWESGHLSASERRVLTTIWAGDAWDAFCASHFARARWRYFEKTGLLMTLDGTDDDKIMPEGSTNYTFARMLADSDAEDDVFDDIACTFPPSDDEGAQDDDDFGDEDEDVHDDEDAVLITFAELAKEPAARGLRVICTPDVPALDATLIGATVAVRIVHVGWQVGIVTGQSSGARVLSYNYKVTYEDDDAAEHLLTAETYVCNAVDTNDWSMLEGCMPGAWLVLTTTVVPRGASWQERRAGAGAAEPQALGRRGV
jgi:transposase-like protein